MSNSTTTYPVGYGTSRATLEEIERRYGSGAPIQPHPEFWRRVRNLLISGEGKFGIGGAYRFEQPNRPGFAPPGKSFHEAQRFASGFVGYSAIDFVVTTRGKHRAPTWAEADTWRKDHIHAFVSGEPWHGQCAEIRGWGSWVRDGRPDPERRTATLKEAGPIPSDFAEGYSPPGSFGDFVLADKPTLSVGDRDLGAVGPVRYLQDVIKHRAGGNIFVDGWFGEQTAGRVRDVQGMFNLDMDGVVGPKTWKVVDALTTLGSKPERGSDTELVQSRYWVRKGDSPWSVGERVYGSGSRGSRLLGLELFHKAHHHIEIPEVSGLRTRVLDGEGPWAILTRLGYKSPGSMLDAFYDWNGGRSRVLHPGDLVYVPTEFD